MMLEADLSEHLYPIDFDVYIFTGDVSRFLNDYTSVQPEDSYGAFLDKKGHIVSTYFNLGVSPGEKWLAIPHYSSTRLFQHLDKYISLYSLKVEKKIAHVYFFAQKEKVRNLSTHSYLQGVIAMPDFQICIANKSLIANMPQADFNCYRVRYAIPWPGIDYDDPLVCELGGLYRLDKGCYLGQEIVARIMHRSKPSRMLRCITNATTTDGLTSLCQSEQGMYCGFQWTSYVG